MGRSTRLIRKQDHTAGAEVEVLRIKNFLVERREVVRDSESITRGLQFQGAVAEVAPAIHSVTANPNVLFPPNHKMVNVTIAVSATDNCDVNPKSKIISVSSNEAGGGQFQITGDLTLKLQAEREGGGKGRIYTIRVRCTDMSNNSSTGAVTVTVPKGGK